MFSILASTKTLLEQHDGPYLKGILMKYVSGQKMSTESKNSLLNDLATVMTSNEDLTIKIATLFSPILLDLLSRACSFCELTNDTFNKHEEVVVCLSKLIWNFPDVARFSKEYFEKSPSIFARFEEGKEPPSKKMKSEARNVLTFSLLRAANLFLIYDMQTYKDLCDWSILSTFLNDPEPRTRWYAYQCLGRIGNVKNINELLKDKFSQDDYLSIAAEEQDKQPWKFTKFRPFTVVDDHSLPLVKISKSDFCKDVVSVERVLLKRKSHHDVCSDMEKFVYVPNVQKSLYHLALAVSAGEPVLLQGPVGCGKTSLVEHLAAVTGRRPYEELLKVQLGDHMDSKMLLGTHVCTEVPGEFIWKSGILIQAMTEGHWLLLEDIDCAPMDVVSLLVPVLQSRSIALPGHANRIKAAAGFQLFATQRLIRGFEGSYVEFRSNTHMVESYFRKIMMDPLTKEELQKVISTKWPRLEKLSDKVLDIYSLFSADLSDEGQQSSMTEPLNLYSSHGRLVSTRDLFKFCVRLSACIENCKKDVNIAAFQNAVDCFCDSIPSAENRQSAAESFGNKLNVSTSKISVMWQQKPNMEKTQDAILIGRASFEIPEDPLGFQRKEQQPVFAFTRHSCVLLEKVAVAAINKEPVLLVGETGTGKTSVVQYLAHITKHKLTVINMSQQSDSVDLIGGFKPVDLVLTVNPIKDRFMSLFLSFTGFGTEQTTKCQNHIEHLYKKKRYDDLFTIMPFVVNRIIEHFKEKKTSEAAQQLEAWKSLLEEILTLKRQLKQAKTTLIFKFFEGALVKAMKKGEWLLLDEINLAEAETLECLAGILEKNDNTLFLFEKGGKEPVKRHPDFRIFACMNPATDVGKKDLPVGIRNRFTEIFVDEIEDKKDLTILVQEYLKTLSLNAALIENIVNFYLHIKTSAAQNLSDGTGHYPHYSLRTLCRALKYASENPCHNVPRTLYEAFCLSFLSQLDNDSHAAVMKDISEKLLGKNSTSVLKQSIPEPRNGKHKQITGYWIKKGNLEIKKDEKYIFTDTVRRNLQDLARIVSASKYPVLLQGETSVGKTSLIHWLAAATGNKCVRINNHEHTDIQEYIGTYSADAAGNLVFKEGILVEAMRNGHWIILDELNLAPTEVMEALNRVLDDNRELFIPETQTLVKAHAGFMIFATQNPPGMYGGRKLLSRAFRNRFIELHFNEIPPPELEEILFKRCKLPMTYSKKLVAVMHDLQLLRRESGVFCGKQGFITLRDLFRWGERYEKTAEPPGGLDWLQLLADEGYLLLAGRVRVDEEIKIIQEALQKHLKRKVNPDFLFNLNENTSFATKDILTKVLHSSLSDNFKNVVWTYSMRRLAVLVGKAMQYKEPVLLIGATGSGKTTICQMFAEIFGKELHSVNCHMHSESADFLGGLRPVRNPEQRENKLFEWVDGPLVEAMRDGNFFLSDEISLADDSVLERLNSVLETEQKILVPERSFDSGNDFEIVAQEGFQFFATMNPGGDYGKKELSPALRNRFTEIWCPSSMTMPKDIIAIVEHNINKKLKLRPYASSKSSGFGLAIAEFLDYFSHNDIGRRITLSIRDVLTWVEFINLSPRIHVSKEENMSAAEGYLHGAFLAIIDGIGSGSLSLSNENFIFEVKKHCYNFLMQQIGNEKISYLPLMMPELHEEDFEQISFFYHAEKVRFGLGPFTIKCGSNIDEDWEQNYVLEASTTKSNVMKVLRAMQLSKPLLLEGSPGVGKTSLISILAKATGHNIVRINLSEQTDITDLFGADLPVDGGENGEFEWRDGPLIQALKKGDWVLLDELNLASQSVLEGLNACLDHRNQIYIPELGKTFYFDKYISRVFCCQNPQMQGGSRKGLPQSFLNRFTKVYMKSIESADMEFIATAVYRNINPKLIAAMVQFNNEIVNEVNIKRSIGQKGSPWEFNLRDIFRWCDLMVANQSDSDYNIGEYVKLIYMDRMRTLEDRERILLKFEDVINSCKLGRDQMVKNRCLKLNVYSNCIQLGYSFLPSKGVSHGDIATTCISPIQLPFMESLMKCIEMNWMAILVGLPGTGKSTLVHALAELCGQELHVLSVNSEMDTIELLGGFEQADINRKIEFIAQDLHPVFEQCVYACLKSDISDHDKRLQDLLYKQHNVRRAMCCGVSSQKDDLVKKLDSLSDLIKTVDSFKLEGTKSVITSCKKALNDLIRKSEKSGTYSGGQFEWVDSMLINAAIKGHWLLIDDANFCSPSVLDRLNALLEPDGVLTVNEQGIVKDELRTIVPHKDFRIILTMNPQNGEISRAMRNRGVEIYIGNEVCITLPAQNMLNLSLFAQCKGLIHNELLLHFYNVYEKLRRDIRDSPSPSDFLSAVSLCVQMIQKHGVAAQAFEYSCVAVFADRYLHVKAKNIALNIIRREMIKVKADYSIPITDFLPSSFDYRQNVFLSALKKQAALYTVFYRHFLGKLFDCAPFPEPSDKSIQAIFVCPPPKLFLSHQCHLNDIRIFTFVMKTVFESCSKQCFQFMIFFLWQWVISNFPHWNNSDKESVKAFHHCVRKYQSMMKEIGEDFLMKNLVDSAACMFNEIGFTEISNDEVPYDLRWNPYVYQKVMIYLRQKHEDPDSVEYELISRANRFSLLLHFKSLKFTIENPPPQNCRNVAACAAEIASNPDAFKDSPLLPLAYLPRFVEQLEIHILKFMNDESMPCSDEYYWKLFDIILYYHNFQRVYTSHAEKGMEINMRIVALNASWLLKKFKNLYQGIMNMPNALLKVATDIENNMPCNTPVQKFRHKCMKKLGSPHFLPDERTADIFRLVAEIFQPMDLIDRLKSPQTKVYDVKVILTNLKRWLQTLGDASFKSLFESSYQRVFTSLHNVKIQMLDVGLIHTDDDDIIEYVENPPEQPTLSNTELALGVQLLPLCDYLFVTFEAEMLSKYFLASKETSLPTLFVNVANGFFHWGVEILGLNPVHLMHLIGVIKCNYEPCLIPSLVYFFRHMRHGFSSDGLSALNFEVKNNEIVIKSDNNKYWHYRYNWSNQYPLLTHIFSSLFEKSSNSSVMCHFPLGSYSEKVSQLKKAQAIVWKHFDRFASPNETFRRYSASIIASWFTKLITAMASLDQKEPLPGSKLPEMDIRKLDKTEILKIIEQWMIMPIIKTEGNDNILFLATENVIELQAKLDERIEDSKLQWVTGKASTLVGLLTSVLLMPRDYLDPGMKMKIKFDTYHDILCNLQIEREMRMWLNNITCGQSLTTDWVAEHPHVQGMKEHIMFYEGKQVKIDQKMPFRPHEELFYAMKNDMGHFVKNLGNPNMIIDIITKLNIVNNMTDENDLSQCDLNPLSIIQKAQKISENLENFVDRMLKKYSVYPDIIYPFLVGVEQIIFGLTLSCNSVIIKEAVNNDPPQKLRHINKLIGMYATFSSDNYKTPLQMAATILNASAFSNLNIILSHTKGCFPSTGRLVYRMIKSAILELANEVKFQKYHPESKLSEIKQLLFSAFQYLYHSWHVQDQIKRKKKDEEEQLYKTVHHEDEISDEEKLDKELKEMFPLYEEEFGDLVKKDVDPDGSVNKAKETSQENIYAAYDEAGSFLFSDQDMFEVCQLHATVMNLLTNMSSPQNNLYITPSKGLDIVTPVLLRHEVMSSIVKTLGHRLDSTLEKTMIREQLLLCQELQQLKGMEEEEYYDIYHDPNPSKVLSINPVLQKLVNHVTALLKEFPENPNLVQILTVTERVLSFPISDPLMKFVVGLELILETSQIWEQNAHSNVSIRPEMEEITEKVIEFRALELNMWKKGLQNVIKKQYVKAAKWWFFMFPLFYTDNTYSESEKKTIIKGLEKCLEDSPIGEFPARLSLLRTFLQEFSLGSSTKQTQSYANILFNMYTYYEQFLPAIEKEISQLKKPVEKDLKDFVKIARWNDVNFYAVKASVQKSHRTVLKLVKNFENALESKKAMTMFTFPSKNANEDQNPWFLDIKKEDYIYKMPKVRSEFFKERNEPFFRTFPKYQRKVKKIAKGIAENFPVAGYVNTLNDFCGNIIEALESATLEGQKAVCTRSREKKQALLKIQNKKQMLATLFKSLKNIGLSYRQGMIYDHQDTELLSIPAFDISKMKVLKSDQSFGELLSKSSSDTNHYFYKSVGQYVNLHKLMESPSKDLTLDIIHRIRGYGGHLLALVTSQRVQLVKLMKNIDNFGCFTSMLSTVYSKQDFTYEKNLTIIPPQKFFKENYLEISKFVEIVSLTVNKFGALLNCAPESALPDNEQYTISSDKRNLSNILKNDGNWSVIKLAIENFNLEIENILTNLSELKVHDNVISWDHLRTFSSICQATQKAVEALKAKIAQFYNTDCLMVQNLVDMCNKIDKTKKAIAEEEEKLIDSQMNEHEAVEESEQSRTLAKLCQNLATQVTLGIQEMFVFSSSFEEENSDNVVPDNIFNIKITESLVTAKNCLRFDKILKIIKRLKVHFRSIENSTEALQANDNSIRLLVNLAPVLNQYYQLIKIHLAVSLGMHRTSSKFLTILLQIFQILAEKGFCVPADLQEEAEKDGATKFEDIEDGGFGEGEGVKDVSSKLESEDQLDEAMKEGEEKKKEDESSDKDLKDEKDGVEMSDDFEGKLHSGEGTKDDSDDDEEQEENEDLDKQMGEVEADEAEKLDDKVWGSDSEDEGEEDLRDDDGTGGVTEHMASELVAKDNRPKEDSDDDDVSEKENKPQEEMSYDDLNEEYEGEKPDPMINAPPSEEPEIEELPEDMEITEEVGKDAEGENVEEMMEPDSTQDEPENESVKDEDAKEEEAKEDASEKIQEDAAEGEKESANLADQEEVEQPADESAETNESSLPTEKPTTEDKALPSSETKTSSADPVQTVEDMDWESGAQSSEEQHKEGLSEAKNAPSEDSGHEGKRSSTKITAAEESKQTHKLKPPGADRSVDESAEESSAKRRPIMEKKSKLSEKSEDIDDTAEMYEHVSKEEESKTQAIDIASKEEAEIRTAEKQSDDDEDYDEEEVINLSSDEEEEPCNKSAGESLNTSQSHKKPGGRGDEEGEMDQDIPEGEIVQTHSVIRSTESTFHTQSQLWKSLSMRPQPSQRLRHQESVDMNVPDASTSGSDERWRKQEMSVSNLAQELCEQLRLVLEPTKMSKFKGDYRTGKRLNMRKIIPYIASQFRKDKIWLRRTKPSKRQYQIMLAVDDSKSMGYNNVKELAFESLAVLGQSLSLLEAGELSVVSFGEKVQLLQGFQEQFSSSIGTRIVEQVTFSQNKTNIAQLVEYATNMMVQARQSSRHSSKETAQLLIIISDGRTIFAEGMTRVKTAVKNARDNNIFMVYLLLDNVEGNHGSVLDIKCTVIKGEDMETVPYMECFPFPFYVILREISALPQVLGEALRQWFELVTSVDR